MKKELCFGTPRGVWASLLTLSLRTTPFGSFTGLSSFSQFFATYSFFQNKIQSSLHFALNIL